MICLHTITKFGDFLLISLKCYIVQDYLLEMVSLLHFYTGISKVAYYKRSKQFNFYLICLLLSASAVTFKSVRRPVFESLHSVHLLHFDEF